MAGHDYFDSDLWDYVMPRIERGDLLRVMMADGGTGTVLEVLDADPWNKWQAAHRVFLIKRQGGIIFVANPQGEPWRTVQ